MRTAHGHEIQKYGGEFAPSASQEPIDFVSEE
jgi:hypothetical protein